MLINDSTLKVLRIDLIARLALNQVIISGFPLVVYIVPLHLFLGSHCSDRIDNKLKKWRNSYTSPNEFVLQLYKSRSMNLEVHHGEGSPHEGEVQGDHLALEEFLLSLQSILAHDNPGPQGVRL